MRFCFSSSFSLPSCGRGWGRLLLLLFLSNLSVNTYAQRADALEENVRKLVLSTVTINNFYVDTVDSKKLVEDAIRGMLEKLDPHSTYTNPEDTKKANEPLQGSFEGIGVQFDILEDTVLVIQPVINGPSEKVGIIPGDRIVSCNDVTLAGVKMSKEAIMKNLRGPKGSIARLGVKRPGIQELMYFDVKRDKIPEKSVDAAYMVTPTIGLIRFGNFGQNTHDELVEAIHDLKKRGMKNLILDLTQNGGGYLQAAAEIASEFLPKGDMIVYTEGRVIPRMEYKSTGGKAFQNGKVAILVDEISASASEILAGAIQDQDRGIIIGRRTFGKGLVQRALDLPDGSMIRLTIAKYYTPSGRCVQKPFEKGKGKDYAMDVINRYNRGELTNADSIHFPDSLRFSTLRKHRTVYGGGGIMPDCFVPLDTTRYTRYYRELSARNLFRTANLHYLDQNRKQLQERYTSFDQFRREYETPDAVIDSIFSEGERLKILPRDDEERQNTIPRIRLLLKALVARDLWDMSEYFAIVYADDESVMKAVELLR